MNDDNDDIQFEESNEEGEVSQGDTVKKLREKLKEAQEKAQEYLLGWQKERAEGVNLRKRLEEEKREFAKFAKEDIATELISVLDSFESAFKNKEAWEKVDKNWRMGVEYIHTQLINILANHGVSIISPLGEKFDPQRDEAVETVPTEKEEEDHKIIEVMSVGYKLQDRLIRAPKVKVGEYKS
ncbi:MAG: nucleotide exchange factor GrpE [Patescibacteria group bacterium]